MQILLQTGQMYIVNVIANSKAQQLLVSKSLEHKYNQVDSIDNGILLKSKLSKSEECVSS